MAEPSSSDILKILTLVVAFLALLGGLFAWDSGTREKVTTHEIRLDNLENDSKKHDEDIGDLKDDLHNHELNHGKR